MLVGQYNWFDESNQKTAVYYNVYHRGSGWEYPMATGDHLTDEDAVFARHPAVAMDATGNGIVVWGQRSGTDDEYEIYARVYLADGSWNAAQAIGYYDPPIQVGGDVANPQVAMDGKGNAVVVWQKYNPPDDNHVIFAQRWDHASQQWGSEAYPISTGNTFCSHCLDVFSSIPVRETVRESSESDELPAVRFPPPPLITIRDHLVLISGGKITGKNLV